MKGKQSGSALVEAPPLPAEDFLARRKAEMIARFKFTQVLHFSELELFHMCGCPQARACVCYIYLTGCGKCSECLKNRLYSKETGSKGERICKLSSSNMDYITLNDLKIEYPRHLIKIPRERAKMMGNNMRQLRFMRKIFNFALQNLANAVTLGEKTLADRSRLAMQLEDPYELANGPKGSLTSAYIDTDLLTGLPARLKKSSLASILGPKMLESTRSLLSLAHHKETIYRHWRAFTAYHIIRVAKGTAARMLSRNRRRAALMHLATLRMQSVWRGYVARHYTVPTLLPALRERSAAAIQRAFRRSRDTRVFVWRTRARLWRIKTKVCTQLQSLFRGFFTRKYRAAVRAEAAAAKAAFESSKRAMLTVARVRRELILTKGATAIQRLWRGVIGRRDVYQRRAAGGVTNVRVKELTDRFLASGDLWGFVAAVNADYNSAEGSSRREAARASAFVDQVIKVRAEKGEKAWKQWQAFKDRADKRNAAGGGEGGTLPAKGAAAQAVAGAAAGAALSPRVVAAWKAPTLAPGRAGAL